MTAVEIATGVVFLVIAVYAVHLFRLPADQFKESE